jgi:hypothetical protein
MASAHFVFSNSRSITHLANYLSQNLPMNSSDESFVKTPRLVTLSSRMTLRYMKPKLRREPSNILDGVQAWLALGHLFAAHRTLRRHWDTILVVPHLQEWRWHHTQIVASSLPPPNRFRVFPSCLFEMSRRSMPDTHRASPKDRVGHS